MRNPFEGMSPDEIPAYNYDDDTEIAELGKTRGQVAAEVGREMTRALTALQSAHDQWVLGRDHDPRAVLRNMAIITRTSITIGAECMGLFKHDVTEMAIRQQTERLDEELRRLS